jgi:hypothetical protein
MSAKDCGCLFIFYNITKQRFNGLTQLAFPLEIFLGFFFVIFSIKPFRKYNNFKTFTNKPIRIFYFTKRS